MKLKEWLSASRGRSTALAEHLHLSLGRVSQMATEGVPLHHMVPVREFTEGAVSIEEMVIERSQSLKQAA